jgi:hypothetical protein
MFEMKEAKRMKWADMYHAQEREEMHANFWEENLKQNEDLEDLHVDGRMMWVLKIEKERRVLIHLAQDRDR